jgi:hypothetical protein
VAFVESQDLDVGKTLFFSFFLVCGSYIFGNVVDDGIKQISFHERICMKIFFDQAIKYDQAAHVLYFKNKPVCMTGVALKYRDKSYKDILALKGWRAFKKNEHLFPHPHFIFSENIFEAGDDCKILHVYFINKETLKSYLGEYQSLFQEVLGKEFYPETFINQLEQGIPLPKLLNEDEMLLGVLLGYGEESALAFKAMRSQCTESYAPPPTETYCRIDLERLKGCKIDPVVFMGNPQSSEVLELRSTYEQELKDAWSIYKQSKNLLKSVLEKLCDR